MLQACLNGGRSKSEHLPVPITDTELAHDALAARHAGADELHVHPRNGDGAETLEPDWVGRCLTAIRAAVPGMLVGVSTGVWIEPGGQARLRRIQAWEVLPDYASVNLSEDDAPTTIDHLLARGIDVEAGIWDRRDAARFIALPEARKYLRVLVEMNAGDPDLAATEYRAVIDILQKHKIDLPILLHGQESSVWPMVRAAAADGFSTRVGFEDGLLLPDGGTAPDNAALVRAAIKIMA